MNISPVRSSRNLFFLLLVTFIAGVAFCDEITILNPSFEDPHTGHTNGALPAGWSVEGSSYGTEVSPYDGQQCMFVGSFGDDDTLLFQLTEHTIAAGDEYTLTFYAKFTWNSGNWPGVYEGGLYYDTGDGNRVIFDTVGNSFASAGSEPGGSYSWIKYSIVVAIAAGDPAIGSRLGFTFTNLTGGTEGWGSWAGCDLVSLDYVHQEPAAFDPVPGVGQQHVNPENLLSWSISNTLPGAVSNMYLDTSEDFSDDPIEAIGLESSVFDPGSVLDFDTTYYWRVDTVDGGNVYSGPVWTFTTGGKATEPVPENGLSDVKVGTVNLNWTGDDFATSYIVYAGAHFPLELVAEVQDSSYSALPIDRGMTTYYWRVDEFINDELTTEGDVWFFTTRQDLQACPEGDLDGDCYVGLYDLAIFVSQWLDPAGCAERTETDCADLVGNDGVDLFDLAVLTGNWNVNNSSVLISEFMASNDSGPMDEDGDSSDWIELYNPTDATIDLCGWFLTDEVGDLREWEFLESTLIEPGEFLVVFASGKNRTDGAGQLHTNFQLSSDGDFLAIVYPDGETISHGYDEYPAQYVDISYGLNDSGTSLTSDVLVAEFAEAKAFVPTADSSLGLSWTEAGFDDSSWLTGNTAVGYEATNGYRDMINLDVISMRNVNETVYIRIPFTVENTEEIKALTLRMKYDDGFAAYLNGQLIEYDRSPDPSELDWNSGATTTHDDSAAVEFVDFDVSDFRAFLVPGDNVLAIHGLNRQKGSSDLLFVPELVAERLRIESASVIQEGYFVQSSPGALNFGSVLNPGPKVSNVSEAVLQPDDLDDIVITAEISETLNPVALVTLRYRVMYGSEVSVVMVDDGSASDSVADDGVYTGVIPAGASSACQMVRWYIVAQDDQGSQTRNPLFPYPLDSDEYYGTEIKDGSFTTELPVFNWFVNNTGAADTRGGTRASVYYDGEFYDNVFVRIRGGTSSSLEKKNHKFDFNKGHYFKFKAGQERVQEANINAAYIDTSYMREKLSQDLLRDAGVPTCYTFPVRVQQNGTFHSLAVFVEQIDKRFLERHDFESDGSLYKAAINGTLFDNAYDFAAKNDSDYHDMVDLVSGLNLSGSTLHNYIFDKLNIPEVIDFLAISVIVAETDHTHKNYYMHFDKSQQHWYIFPWDRDLSFGHRWTGVGIITNVSIFTGDNNRLFNAIFHTEVAREMFFRRLRTLMDQFLGESSVPSAQREIDVRISELYDIMKPEADLDRAIWGYTNSSWYNRLPQVNIDGGVSILLDQFLPGRRNFLYNSSSVPNAQPDSFSINIGAIDYNPASTNQDQEYIEFVNPNSFAADISGWKISGAVEHDFYPGTVIPAGGSLFVSPDAIAFKSRSISPTGGQGRFIQGNYKGHLSSWGETVEFRNALDTIVASKTYAGSPSDQQKNLRVTEVMYHPAKTGSDNFNEEEYEFVELTNISGSSVLLDGVKFTNGIQYEFADGGDVSLDAGESIVLVRNLTAFSERYNVSEINIPVGQYSGYLSNSGETLKLEDHTNSTILEFGYNDGWYAITDGTGFSLTIVDENNPDLQSWDSKVSWRPSIEENGSPGSGDTGAIVSAGAVVISEVLTHTDDIVYGDWIELHNTTGAVINIGGWFLSDDADDLMKYEIAADDPRALLEVGEYIVFTAVEDFRNSGLPIEKQFGLSEHGEEVFLSSGLNGQLAGGYQVSQDFGTSVRDRSFGRYIKSQASGYDVDFVTMEQTMGSANNEPIVGPIVIREINYNSPESDSIEEFIELKNISGGQIAFYDPANPGHLWQFTKGIEFVFPAWSYIGAGEVVLVTRDDPESFRARHSIGSTVQIFGPFEGKLDNGGEKIELSKPSAPDAITGFYSYIRVDMVNYSDNAPWPGSADGDGSSLFRINDSGYGNDVANWSAALPTPGQ